jgi:hypothetical protein
MVYRNKLNFIKIKAKFFCITPQRNSILPRPMDEEILSPTHNHSQAHSSPKKSSNRNTPSKRGLTSHCTICSQEFTSRKAYINHIIDAHTVKSYVCKHIMGNTSYSPLCRKVFTIFVVFENLNFNRNLGNWSI